MPPRSPAGSAVAAERPIAAVLVDTPLAHLNRPFEYTVPADLDAAAQPGVRVKVRFAGKDRDGFLLERRAEAEFPGRLAPLRRVVSDEVVLSPEIATVARRVAEYYGGNTADVLRLAIPPRHARAEKRGKPAAGKPAHDEASKGAAGGSAAEETDAAGGLSAAAPTLADSAWADYPAGRALLRHLSTGGFPAAAWTAVPDGGSPHGWPLAIAQATAATVTSGRGVVIVVPDHRDVDRVAAALDETIGNHAYVRLTADLGPEKRYATWLRVSRGEVSVVLGARGAAYAPVSDLGLVVWWDDADDLHDEPRAPYPHTRTVLRLRAEAARAGLLVGGYTRSVAVQGWVWDGWMQPVTAEPATVRRLAPRVVVAGEGHQERDDPAAAAARIPTVAWRAIRDALSRGPVLVQVPRRGYLAGLACQRCRQPVRCAVCAGPMAVAGPGRPAHCQWCTRADSGAPCAGCGGTGRRSTVVGHRRTAEELGQAFPGVPVLTSGGEHVLAQVGPDPRLVLATPGAEPVAVDGYAATVLLDGWALVDRAGLDSSQEALRRWAGAAALVAPAQRQGPGVVLVGVPAHAGLAPVEALVRWDPAWFAAREWQERLGLQLPPAASVAVLRGDAEPVAAAVADARRRQRDRPGQAGVLVLDPVPVAPPPTRSEMGTRSEQGAARAGASADPADTAFALVRAPRSEHREVVTLVREVVESRSRDKTDGTVRARVDPADLTW